MQQNGKISTIHRYKEAGQLSFIITACKYARIYQPSSNEISGKVQQMPQTGNTRFYPGSPDGCVRELDRIKK